MIMPEHPRKRGALLLSKLQDMGGDIATYIAIECHDVCDEDTVEDRKQQQRVFGRFRRGLRLVQSTDVPVLLPLWLRAQNTL